MFVLLCIACATVWARLIAMWCCCAFRASPPVKVKHLAALLSCVLLPHLALEAVRDTAIPGELSSRQPACCKLWRHLC